MRTRIIGAGSVGKRHLTNFRQLGIEHLGAVDPRDDRRQEIVERFAPARAYADLDEALREGYDAVVVCAPTAHHTEAARRSLRLVRTSSWKSRSAIGSRWSAT